MKAYEDDFYSQVFDAAVTLQTKLHSLHVKKLH